MEEGLLPSPARLFRPVPCGGEFKGHTKLLLVVGLEQIPAGMSHLRPVHRLRIRTGSQVNDGHGNALDQLARCINAIQRTRQMHVHEHHVRPQFIRHLQRLLS